MAITAEIQLVVPDLPDVDVWFANAASWTNYWNGISGNVTLDAIATTLYVPIGYDNTLQFPVMVIDGVQYNLVTKQMLDSLLAKVNVLDAGFQDMRQQLKDGGLISNSQ